MRMNPMRFHVDFHSERILSFQNLWGGVVGGMEFSSFPAFDLEQEWREA